MPENTLRVRRAEKGGMRLLSQTKVARATRMSQSRYCLLESGKQAPTDAEARRLSKYFGCPVGVLFPHLSGAVTEPV